MHPSARCGGCISHSNTANSFWIFFSEECMVSEKLQISEKVYFREDVFIGYVLSPDQALDHIYICSNVYAATLHSYLMKYI